MKKVLICDDENDIREVLAMMLELEFEDEFEIVHAENGAEGIQKLKDIAGFDLIICDMNMPKLKGSKVYDFNVKNLNIPFILLSADCEEDVKSLEGFSDNEQNAIVKKPWHGEELFEKVGFVLSQKSYVA